MSDKSFSSHVMRTWRPMKGGSAHGTAALCCQLEIECYEIACCVLKLRQTDHV